MMTMLNSAAVAPGVHGRLVLSSAKFADADQSPRYRIILPYENRGLEAAHPANMISDLIDHFGLQFDKSELQVTWSYNDSLQSFFYKPAAVFRDSSMSFSELESICSSGKCACSVLPAACRNHSIGHLHSNSTDWISKGLQLPRLASELQKGLNHVPPAPISLDHVVYVNQNCAESFHSFLPANTISLTQVTSFATSWTLSRADTILAYPIQDCIDTSSPPFQPVQYTQFMSYRPISQSYKSFCGLTYSAVLHNSTPSALIRTLRHYLQLFVRNGYQRRKCIRTILLYLESTEFPFTFFDLDHFRLTVHKHL
jgi:hypothetical protein